MNERQDIERAVRASDSEREHIAKMIGEAAGEGRLSIAEADERLERVYTTRFRHELAEFVADLPAEPAGTAPARLGRFPVRLRVHAGVAVVVSILLILRWAAMDVPFFWPAGPMFVLWGTFLLHALLVRSGRVPPWARQRSGQPWWAERQRADG
ncbi:DUF1707 domain-containing protein [Actinophytocola sp.]|uniref:DUF1707 SHOCT-like domain-containing protein n=1 Tax=Actinophytocola sp. TaxID=1872138 RepID=UPI002D2DDB43|nr:DUF1707 domain-containing protein [Actinophytocola sp.]HYQ67258.1 DUF1707 domain-containing protein [Actinophytocola sp.]